MYLIMYYMHAVLTFVAVRIDITTKTIVSFTTKMKLGTVEPVE